jgi:hypothetical protein
MSISGRKLQEIDEPQTATQESKIEQQIFLANNR